MFVETILENGGVVIEWVSPPIAPTHKTEGITLIEWASLFQPNEPVFIDELEDHINDLSYQVAGSALSLDDLATIIDPNTVVTYRQLLRTSFKRFNAASKNGITVSHPLVVMSLVIFEAFGLIGNGRKETILMGLPL